MRVEEADGGVERKILLACITRSDFLGRIYNRLGKDPCKSRWSNVLYAWCKDHYAQYKRAPGKEIESLFATYASNGTDKDTARTLERFLASLSGEYEKEQEEIQLDYTLDLAEKHFNTVLLSKMQEEITALLRTGKVKQALKIREKFKKVELNAPAFVNVLEDIEAQRKALEDKQKVLIRYPGPAGDFFGNELAEDSFIGIMAPPKGQKSFLLLDLAWRAMRQHRRVAYFQVGDLTKNQIIRRFQRRAAYRPLGAREIRTPNGIMLPSGAGKELAIVDFTEKKYEDELSWEVGQKAFARALKKSRGGIRLAYHPTKTVNAVDIQTTLARWDEEGWLAQVVILDYAGNLAPIDPRELKDEQIATTWATLRQISEVRNCLMITGNQTNKEGFRSWVLTRNNFRGSLMILAHVTAFLGINMTEEEKERNIVRYNWIERREEGFNESKCLYCASCLEIANPIIVSCLP